MAGDFTSSYQRTKYWLDLLWPERKQQLEEHEAQERETEQLNEADFEDGFRYEQTEKDTYLVQQYPTGRYIGEIRQTEDGTWETRHRPDAEWDTADYQPAATDAERQDAQPEAVQEEARRTLVAQHLEQRHCGEIEAGLIQRGIYIDYEARYSLETLHNADNALGRGVDRTQVDAYIRHHVDPGAEPNEDSVAVEAVPGSTQWNTADPHTRQQILTTSPWAVQQDQQQQHLEQQHQHVAQQQTNQQLKQQDPARQEASTQGVER